MAGVLYRRIGALRTLEERAERRVELPPLAQEMIRKGQNRRQVECRQHAASVTIVPCFARPNC